MPQALFVGTETLMGGPTLGPTLKLSPWGPLGVVKYPTLRFFPNPTFGLLDGSLGALIVISTLAPPPSHSGHGITGNTVLMSFVAPKFAGPSVALALIVTGMLVKGMLNDSCPCCWQYLVAACRGVCVGLFAASKSHVFHPEDLRLLSSDGIIQNTST